jgi:hypothetical protein
LTASSTTEAAGEVLMFDLIFVAATLAFFAAAIGYVRFCDRVQ